MPDEIVNSVTASNYSVTPNLSYYGTKTRVKFDGSSLKQDKVAFNHEKVVNNYIVYEIIRVAKVSKYSSNDNYPTLENMLFGAVSLTKYADIDKYKYSGIGFDRRSSFSHQNGGDGWNVIIFRVDMSSSTKNDNRKKDLLIPGKGSTQGLEHRLTAEKMYSVNFCKDQTKFCLSLHYNGANSNNTFSYITSRISATFRYSFLILNLFVEKTLKE